MCGGMCAGECGGGQESLQWEGERWKVFSCERSNWNTRGRGRIEERVGVRGDWEEGVFFVCKFVHYRNTITVFPACVRIHMHTRTHTPRISNLSYSTKSKRLAVGARSGQVGIYDLKQGRTQVRTLLFQCACASVRTIKCTV